MNLVTQAFIRYTIGYMWGGPSLCFMPKVEKKQGAYLIRGYYCIPGERNAPSCRPEMRQRGPRAPRHLQPSFLSPTFYYLLVLRSPFSQQSSAGVHTDLLRTVRRTTDKEQRAICNNKNLNTKLGMQIGVDGSGAQGRYILHLRLSNSGCEGRLALGTDGAWDTGETKPNVIPP